MVLVVKNPPANAGDMRPGFNLWIRKNLWKRSLAGYTPWDCKELDMT